MPSDSFERGGQPRSVPDPDSEGYDRMIRAHRALTAGKEHAAGQAKPAAPTARGPLDAVVAGVVHILNEPRAARREVEQGHVVKGAVDAVAAGSDLELGRSIASGIDSGAFKISGSHTGGATRKWLGRTGRAMKGQHVHHGLIPNGGWGKAFPDFIKNQPWNLKFTETPLEHIRIHGQSHKFGLPQFNVVQRYFYGTPTWWKAAKASAVAHAAEPVAREVSKAGHFLADHLKNHPAATPKHQSSLRRP